MAKGISSRLGKKIETISAVKNMDIIRIVISIFLFFMGCYFTFDLILNDFNWKVLVALISCFLAAYLIWPKDHHVDGDWIELIGNIIEFPFRLMIWISRGIVRLMRDNDGVDL